MSIRSVLIKSEEVENLERRFGSAVSYYPCYVQRKNGTIVPALFTAQQIYEAVERAASNPEDIPERAGWIEKIFGGNP